MALAEFTLPVFMRVGGTPEVQIGEITVALREGVLELTTLRSEIAVFYREAAAAFERPLPDDAEEVPDAAA